MGNDANGCLYFWTFTVRVVYFVPFIYIYPLANSAKSRTSGARVTNSAQLFTPAYSTYVSYMMIYGNNYN